ncbi:hypothetical protein ACJIZ3_011489 [Penstemon smallii]|uniref:Uncharacterized protein n=1 Tax=Penstemon smallii TaxID=265156 RepID=A0ABD3UMT7_9LAMI
MEIPTLLYFSFWSIVSIAFLGLGFMALDEQKTEVSPIFMFLLKRVLAIFVCHSSTYALVHRPGANVTLLNHLKLSTLGFSFPLYVYFVLGAIPLKLILCYAFLVIVCLFLLTGSLDFALSIDFFVRAIIFSIGSKGDRFFPLFVLVSAFITAGVAAVQDEISSGPEANGEKVEKLPRKKKIVEFAVFVVCSLVFQFFVRFTSFGMVLAFLCFAAAWLSCLAVVMPRRDFGVFDLLVYNVLICCVNQFGLSGPTLFAYVVFVILFILHSKLQTVRLVHGQDIVMW